MRASTRREFIAGPAGRIECAVDKPDGSAKGVALVAHPHPLFGGTLDNKVVQTLARAFTQSGWTAVRFNFRGIGASEGAYDEGRGEVEDMLAVVQQAAPAGALALAGFSFGGFVTSQVFARLQPVRAIDKLVLVAPAASRFAVAPVAEAAHEQTLVIHGEQDDTVPLQAVMDWARPQLLPVTVVPGGGHFFHGQLPLLKSLVARHLR
jgi:alpha/beta superfamily hydrolase